MQYEVEVRCLLESADHAENLLGEIRGLGFNIEQIAEYRQLNDYYVGGNITQLATGLADILEPSQLQTLQDIIANNSVFSVRGRQNNEEVLFIVKATAGSSANHGTQRAEFEVPVAISLAQLKDVVQANGYALQARWAARRKLYKISNGITLNNYFTPGYGYGAEFELLVDSRDEVEDAEKRVREFVYSLGLKQVDKDRIERMFTYYNEHWQEYYNTEKTFQIE